MFLGNKTPLPTAISSLSAVFYTNPCRPLISTVPDRWAGVRLSTRFFARLKQVYAFS
ncbi:hypothetical protein XHV734_2457 [Xanthomonas hortorum pv. vitians]|nr:hypothetical protein XHV734_2457 [Xanthomonas hortorum pv. vitians]